MSLHAYVLLRAAASSQYLPALYGTAVCALNAFRIGEVTAKKEGRAHTSAEHDPQRAKTEAELSYAMNALGTLLRLHPGDRSVTLCAYL